MFKTYYHYNAFEVQCMFYFVFQLIKQKKDRKDQGCKQPFLPMLAARVLKQTITLTCKRTRTLERSRLNDHA